MGFFSQGDVKAPSRGKKGTPSTRLLHELSCKACPLNHAKVHSPKLAPSGAVAPLVYMLGGAPSEEDDKQGGHFVGISGQYLKDKIPSQFINRILWDNVVRDRAPGAPDPIAIECCRPNVSASIEGAKPKAVFGFGNVALRWALGKSGIANWRGRRIPIRVGSHACWFFPFDHPADLLAARHALGRQYMTEDERMFDLDIRRAFYDLPSLPQPKVHTAEDARAGVETINTYTDDDVAYIEEFLRWAAARPVAGYDYETNRKRPYHSESRILSLAVSAGGRALSFGLEHPQAKWSPERLVRVWGAVEEFLRAPVVRKAVHNLAFELEWTGVMLDRNLIRAGLWGDSMSQAFVLDQRAGGKGGGGDDDDGVMECFGLGFLTHEYFGLDIKSLSNVNTKDMMAEPLDAILPYNAIDAKYHELLYNAQDQRLHKEGLHRVYLERQLPRVATTVLTQIKGIPLDAAMAVQLSGGYKKEEKEIEKEIESLGVVKQFFKQRGEKFNPMSNPDMVVMCRDFLKSKIGEKVTRVNGQEKRSYSVDEATLAKIDHPLMKLALRLRGVHKLRSTYCFTPSSGVVYPDGMLHPMFNTVRARTSRLSSSEPNFQNIPKRTEEGKQIRKQFHALVRNKFVSADYGQIEARVFGMASKDKTFCKALWEGYDVHAEWARRLALAYPPRVGGRDGLNDPKVMKKFRDDVKGGWVFAGFFGAQLPTMARQVGIEEQYLKREFEQFWYTFSGVKKWQDQNHEFYKKRGYVEMLTGRRRCGPLSFNAVTNTPIQGTAAEIVMDGMCRISEMGDWDLQPIWNIHDDLGEMLEYDKLDDALEVIAREMVRVTFPFINVPLVAEVSVGDTMYDLQEIGKISSADFGHKPPSYLGM